MGLGVNVLFKYNCKSHNIYLWTGILLRREVIIKYYIKLRKMKNKWLESTFLKWAINIFFILIFSCAS